MLENVFLNCSCCLSAFKQACQAFPAGSPDILPHYQAVDPVPPAVTGNSVTVFLKCIKGIEEGLGLFKN